MEVTPGTSTPVSEATPIPLPAPAAALSTSSDALGAARPNSSGNTTDSGTSGGGGLCGDTLLERRRRFLMPERLWSCCSRWWVPRCVPRPAAPVGVPAVEAGVAPLGGFPAAPPPPAPPLAAPIMAGDAYLQETRERQLYHLTKDCDFLVPPEESEEALPPRAEPSLTRKRPWMARDPFSDGDLALPPEVVEAATEAAAALPTAGTGAGVEAVAVSAGTAGNTWCVTLIWLDHRSARSRQWASTRRSRGVLKKRASASRLASGRISRNLESASISRNTGFALLSSGGGEDDEEDEEVVLVAMAFGLVGVSPLAVVGFVVEPGAGGIAQDRGNVQARITSSCCKSSSTSRPATPTILLGTGQWPPYYRQTKWKKNEKKELVGPLCPRGARVQNSPENPPGSGLWMGPHTSCTLTGRGSAVSRSSCGNWYTRERSTSTSTSPTQGALDTTGHILRLRLVDHASQDPGCKTGGSWRRRLGVELGRACVTVGSST
ncbi:Succinate--CoA ligase [ADP-forming] subunit beta, partial [Frankliniella fusca]